jgi:hypothetical protein
MKEGRYIVSSVAENALSHADNDGAVWSKPVMVVVKSKDFTFGSVYVSFADGGYNGS